MGKAEHDDPAAIDAELMQRAVADRMDSLIVEAQALLLRMRQCLDDSDKNGGDSTEARLAVDLMTATLASWHTMQDRVAATMPSIDTREDQRVA